MNVPYSYQFAVKKIYTKNDIEQAVKKQEKNVSLRKTQY